MAFMSGVHIAVDAPALLLGQSRASYVGRTVVRHIGVNGGQGCWIKGFLLASL